MICKKNNEMVLLNTHSFQTPEFYKKLGYTEILKLSI